MIIVQKQQQHSNTMDNDNGSNNKNRIMVIIIIAIRKCNTFYRIICNTDYKTQSLTCERNFS